MRVEVYRNIPKQNWSVRSVETGLVIDHADIVSVSNARFVVQQAGRDKVVRTHRKNVHAMVRGEWVSTEEAHRVICNRRVSYNPYKANYFWDVETGLPITISPSVILTDKGQVFMV